MKVINLWAGPGAGKSTTAAGLFFLLKTAGHNVELVTEYAKDLTWEDRQAILEDQLYVTAKQNRRLHRLEGHGLDFVVTDSPLLLGYQYTTPGYLNGAYEKLLFELWNRYDNVNFVLNRMKKYNPIGRNQTEEEARQIDKNILDFLKEHDIMYTKIDGEADAHHVIKSHLENL